MGQDVVSPKAAGGRSGRGEQTSQGRGAPPSATESGRRPFVQLQTGPAGWGPGRPLGHHSRRRGATQSRALVAVRNGMMAGKGPCTAANVVMSLNAGRTWHRFT